MICKIYSCWDDTLNNSDYCHRHCSMNRLQAEMIETKETLDELRTIDIEDIAPSDPVTFDSTNGREFNLSFLFDERKGVKTIGTIGTNG